MSVPRWVLFAVSLALLTYPRAFRRRFGAEMRRDILQRHASNSRTADASTTRPQITLRALEALILNGLAERAIAARHWIAPQPHSPRLYAFEGSRLMRWESFVTDLRFAIRQALKAPLFTSLAVLALALGIGANSAIFTIVDAVLLRPLPYAEPDRLVMVWSHDRTEGRERNVVSPANFVDYKSMSRSFATMDYTLSFLVSLVIKGADDAVRVHAMRTGPHLFGVLGREASLGRTYGPADRDVAVISHGFWTRQFGQDPAVIGRTLTFHEDETVTIVGVMPADFVFPYRSMFGPWASGRDAAADLWILMPFEGPRWIDAGGNLVRNLHALTVFARLRPGATVDEAQSDLATVARQLEQAYPTSNTGWGVTVVPLAEQTTGEIRPALLLLLTGVGVLLLIASVNVANLVLARSVARQRELAIRAALGASRAKLARQALTESLLLSLAGALGGLLLVRWGVQALVALAPAELPRVHEASPDLRVVLVTMLVAVATGVLVGAIPALLAGRADVRGSLQDDGRGTTGSASRGRARAALVVAEVALASLLAVGAVLVVRSFTKLLGVDPGFRAENLLTLRVNAPGRLTTADARRAFYEELFDRLQAIPGVIAVGGTTRIPLGSSSVTTSVQVEGRPVPTGELPEVEFRRAMRDYFTAMGMPIVRGRSFTAEDGPMAAPVVVINQAMASRVFGGADPIGQRIRTGPNPTGAWITIVGVVGSVRHSSLEADPAPELYVNYMSNPPVQPFIAIRTATADARDIATVVRHTARTFDPSMPVYDMRTMLDLRADSVGEHRFVLLLIGVFGVLALVLAGLGVYGVMALVVAERSPEVGMRLALGARPGQVLAMVLRQAVGLAALGVAIGMLLATVLAPLVASQLFGIAPHDLVAFASASAILLGVAVLAALAPAARAMRLDPVTALRHT